MRGDPSLASRLARRRFLARLALGWEAIWPRLWPVLGVLGLFLVLALLEVPQRLPFWAHLILLAGFAGATGLSAGASVIGFQMPSNPPPVCAAACLGASCAA